MKWNFFLITIHVYYSGVGGVQVIPREVLHIFYYKKTKTNLHSYYIFGNLSDVHPRKTFLNWLKLSAECDNTANEVSGNAKENLWLPRVGPEPRF